MAFPTLRANSGRLDGSVRRLFGDANGAHRVKPAAVHHGMIGRGHVGKTALFRVLKRLALQYELPSKLQFDVSDPKGVAQIWRLSHCRQQRRPSSCRPKRILGSPKWIVTASNEGLWKTTGRRTTG